MAVVQVEDKKKYLNEITRGSVINLQQNDDKQILYTTEVLFRFIFSVIKFVNLTFTKKKIKKFYHWRVLEISASHQRAELDHDLLQTVVGSHHAESQTCH